MSRIAVIGAGYVGLVTAAGLAKLGHDVTCLEVDPRKVAAIKAGLLPISEPHLGALWRRYQRRSTLRITGDYAEGLPGCDLVFFCVGTPQGRNGSVDLLHLVKAVTRARESLRPDERPIFVIRSTVPLRTSELVEAMLAHFRSPAERPPVVSNPEFLREGQAVNDFLRPTRVIIGSDDEAAASQVAEVYAPLKAPIVLCGPRTAELIKYASNAFLAAKVSFINEMAGLCDSYDVDVAKVAEVLGMNPDVGPDYLGAGLGWGGSCLPKDLAALIRMADVQGLSKRLLAAVQKVNERQPHLVVSKLRRLLGHLEGRTIAVWGLTFKPNCDDMRDSPALALIRRLQRQGCRVNAYDPAVPPAGGPRNSELTICDDPYAAASGADAIVLATAWREFRGLDFQRLRQLVRRPLLVDARSCLPVEEVEGAGFTYIGVGRGLFRSSAATADAAGASMAAGLRPPASPGEPVDTTEQSQSETGPSLGSRHGSPRRICVVGASYAGLTLAACLAKLGHDVTCLEADLQKVAEIKDNHLPIKEPALESLWREYQRRSTLRITANYAEAIRNRDFIFLCVGTSVRRNGNVDLSHLFSAVSSAIQHLGHEEQPIFVMRSAVPAGTTEKVAAHIEGHRPQSGAARVVSNPELLREGRAVQDFLSPPSIVIGSADQAAAAQVADLYASLPAPIVFCSSPTAELVAYASSAILASKTSFINEIAELCESHDVDVTKVADVLGMDPRIRRAYLEAGLGWGGSRLPKDLATLIRMAAGQGVSSRLLTAVQRVNDRQPRLVVGKLRRLLGQLEGRTVAVWGLTFKPDSDDTQDSPALALVRLLQRQGCRVNAYDPVATLAVGGRHSGLTTCVDPYAAASGADAIVLATAWGEFQGLDFQRLRQLVHQPFLVDARNCLPLEEVEAAGFTYFSAGRATIAPSECRAAVQEGQVAAAGADGHKGSAISELAASATKELIGMEWP